MWGLSHEATILCGALRSLLDADDIAIVARPVEVELDFLCAVREQLYFVEQISLETMQESNILGFDLQIALTGLWSDFLFEVGYRPHPMGWLLCSRIAFITVCGWSGLLVLWSRL